jgi:hypothetical protein
MEPKTTKTKSNPNLLAMCLGACCLLMGLALIGAFMGDKDTSLKSVATTPPQPTTITNNNYHVNGQPTTQMPDLPQMPQVRPTQVSTVAYAPQPQPQTVVIQASSEPVAQQKIIYVEQPRPEPVPDTTIVIYKPEVRQPVQKIVVIDERFERLKAEHEQRMREWTSGPVVVVGSR